MFIPGVQPSNAVLPGSNYRLSLHLDEGPHPHCGPFGHPLPAAVGEGRVRPCHGMSTHRVHREGSVSWWGLLRIGRGEFESEWKRLRR